MERALELKSVGNARELGGIPIGDKTVKHNRLLRTASLIEASEEDKNALREKYHVTYVVDLRMSLELGMCPDPVIPGIENLFLPVFEAEDFPGFNEDMAKILTDPNTDRFELMKTAYELGSMNDELYVSFLFEERGKKAYRTFFEYLDKLGDDEAILWHCTDGKDRTGIAAMLVLTALGADRDVIMSDYMLTNEYNKEKIAAARAGLESVPMDTELKDTLLFGAGAVYEAYMNNALLEMEKVCGSPAGYLEKELGINSKKCDEFRRKFLD